MVERPIKKSERAAQASTENPEQMAGDGQRPVGDHRPQRAERGSKDKRGGKKRGDREEKKPAVSPALMRGPRPKPAAPVEELQPEPEVVPELEAEAETAVTEAPAEAEAVATETPAEAEAEVVVTETPSEAEAEVVATTDA